MGKLEQVVFKAKEIDEVIYSTNVDREEGLGHNPDFRHKSYGRGGSKGA